MTPRIPSLVRRLGLAVAVAAGLGPLGSSAVLSAAPPDGYLDQDALLAALRDLAGGDEHCAIDVIGSSREGRGLVVLTLAADPAAAASRPALLITSGLDGRRLVGTETALRVARRLLAEHAASLEEMTVYVIPRANPDGAAASYGSPLVAHAGTARPIDEDHDGLVDEDGPADLDGDGAVTMMRRLDPPLDDTATHMADPAAPRLLKAPDAAKGETARYAVYTEGLDRDGDGRIAEDGPGAVDLDRNFMHRWPEHATDAGSYPLSEPESAALASFVLAHPNIVAAITYGRHDNLVNAPDSKGRDVTGRAPKEIDPGDAALYKEIGEKYRSITGQKRAPHEDTAGAFSAWLYAQRGIPSFETVVWGRPDPSPPAEAAGEGAKQETGAGEAESGGKDGAGEGAKGAAKDDAEKPAKPADEEAAAWLEYSDRDRGGAGFVEWHPFTHPTLGPVEIGGFVPGFRSNPPAAELDELAEKQTAFVLDLLERRPRLRVEPVETKALADGVCDVRLGIVNDGYLPSATVMARRARSVPPTVVRLSTPLDHIVAGDRVQRIWGIDGSGSRAVLHWIVRAAPGASIEIEIVNRQLGDRKVEFTAPGAAAGGDERSDGR